MGTNSKTTHQSYIVAPTATLDIASDIASPASPDTSAGPATPASEVWLDDLIAADATQMDDAALEAYYAMVVAKAMNLVGVGDGPVIQAQNLELAKWVSGKCLPKLTPAQLCHLAAEKGFQYPQLVGFSGATQHPLVHWLDPAYPDDSDTKTKIQAVAQSRFDALCAGEILAGKNLAQWQKQHPNMVPPPGPAPDGSAWTATPAQVVEAQAALAHILATIGPTPVSGGLAGLIGAENHLATASCAELGPSLAMAVAGARAQVDLVLTSASGAALHGLVEKSTGSVPPGSHKVLDDRQLVALLRASTTADERNSLTLLAADRQKKLDAVAQADAVVNKYVGKNAGPLPAALGPAGNTHAVSAFLDAAATSIGIKTEIFAWTPTAHTFPAEVGGNHTPAIQNTITAWANQQPLAALRDFAENKHGLGPTAQVATKSQIAHILKLGVVNDAVAKEAAADLGKQLHSQLAAHSTATTPTPANAPKSAPAAPSKAANAAKKAKSGFGVQHAQLLDALRHAQASHAALPPRLDPSVVADFHFGDGTPAALGGTGPKTIHTGPDGSTWLAKPRSQALVHAEVAASKALARANLPGVPVYAATLGDRPASVQPMITGATPVKNKPGKWTQADVDAMVRLHVASWAVGNHDVHSDNVLRTADGGLVPIDGGQAFKFYGQDQLSMHYRPSTTPVHHQAYDAMLAGTLPKGVTVNPAAAHPVIKSFESIPDAEWRAMLHQTAHAGAKNDTVTWVPVMRAKAAAKHGVAPGKVSHTQVAEAFLDHAVERKNSLRKSFAAFFGAELKLPAGTALEHLG